MSDWPEGWYRESPSRPPAAGGDAPAGGDVPAAGSADPTVRLSSGGGRAGTGQPGTGYEGGQAPPSRWPQQPPARTGAAFRPARQAFRPALAAAGGAGRAGGSSSSPASIVVVLLVAAGLYFYLDSKLHRENVLVNYRSRPAASAGSNWLITGSDSRQGLSRAQERQFSTGRDIGGHRLGHGHAAARPGQRNARGAGQPAPRLLRADPWTRLTTRSMPRTRSADPSCWPRPCRISPACASTTSCRSASAASSTWSTRSAG